MTVGPGKFSRSRWRWHPYVRTHGDLPLATRVFMRIAHFLGTPRYLIGQSLLVMAWLTLNAVVVPVAWFRHWDPYPFILLNLAFSTQASYAAPIILMAQNRADEEREKIAKLDHEMLLAQQQHAHETRVILELLAGNLGVSVEEINAAILPHTVQPLSAPGNLQP